MGLRGRVTVSSTAALQCISHSLGLLQPPGVCGIPRVHIWGHWFAYLEDLASQLACAVMLTCRLGSHSKLDWVRGP